MIPFNPHYYNGEGQVLLFSFYTWRNRGKGAKIHAKSSWDLRIEPIFPNAMSSALSTYAIMDFYIYRTRPSNKTNENWWYIEDTLNITKCNSISVIFPEQEEKLTLLV